MTRMKRDEDYDCAPDETPRAPAPPVVVEFVNKTDYPHAAKVFEEIDSMEPRSKKTWRKKVELCRYPDVPCEEETRFILEGGKDDNDFIHANKVTFEGVNREYIIAMAPMKNTMDDFWRMVYQSRAPGVVMLGPFYENGKELQEQFWPELTNEQKVFGRMIVTHQSTKHYDHYTAFKLLVKPAKGGSEQITVLYHYLLFTPTVVDASMMHRCVSTLSKRNPTFSPLIVVGGSGTSRACTFVLLDALMTRLEKQEPMSLDEMAVELRRQRATSFHNNKTCFFVVPYTILSEIEKKFDVPCDIYAINQRYWDEGWKKR